MTGGGLGAAGSGLIFDGGVGSFGAGVGAEVGIVGALPSGRSSIISRLGFVSCEVETSTPVVRSKTTRVTPGVVSATRTFCTSLSSMTSE